MQLDDGADEESEDSDGGETPERSHRTSASGRNQRVRASSASTHSGVACQVRNTSVQLGHLDAWQVGHPACARSARQHIQLACNVQNCT